jgi:peptide/nickel transport system ATP-binding protein
MHSFIAARGLFKIYRTPEQEIVALQGLDLSIERGEFVALIGPSGAGKSTLLNAIGGLERVSAGRLYVDGQDLARASIQQLAAYRRRHVGFVWQQTSQNLLPYLSAQANIELLSNLAGQTQRSSRAWAHELLHAVDMSAYARHRPSTLSGGQQQRIAIACALATRPNLLLGDEPTGEVDWPTAQRILELFATLRTRYGTTIMIITHDERVAAAADRIVAIHDGRVRSDNPTRVP